MTPAVVILAYSRPAALRRLLDSVAKAAYPSGASVTLVISIDPGGSPEVAAIAQQFRWTHGEKSVVVHDQHLGLVAHFHWAGGRAQQYGSIVLLEDDLFVSAAYYTYASAALSFYDRDDRIAGVSLYALWFNGYNHLPFEPIHDGSDAFFLQVPYYIGQAFTAAQWKHYMEWRAGGGVRPQPGDPLHPLFLKFALDDWFPERVKYLVETGRFYVFPRDSVSVNFGDPGTHFSQPTAWFQVPLQHRKTQWRFASMDASDAVYDSFFEILPDRLTRLAPTLGSPDFDVDLYASKPAHAHRFDNVLTSRRSDAPVRRFGRAMRPMEANIVQGVQGEEIVLSPLASVRRGWWEGVRLRARLSAYFARGKRPSLSVLAVSAVLKWWDRFGVRGG